MQYRISSYYRQVINGVKSILYHRRIYVPKILCRCVIYWYHSENNPNRITYIVLRDSCFILRHQVENIQYTETRAIEVNSIKKYMMDSNTLILDPVKPKIGHSWVLQAQVACMYVHSRTPVSMTCKDQTHCIKPVFLISHFRK